MSEQTTAKKELLLNSIGEFTWLFDNRFFIETDLGNFVWSSPDYEGGDNTVRQFKGTLPEYLAKSRMDYGRAKGAHLLSRYMGTEFTVVED